MWGIVLQDFRFEWLRRIKTNLRVDERLFVSTFVSVTYISNAHCVQGSVNCGSKDDLLKKSPVWCLWVRYFLFFGFSLYLC